MNLNLGIPALTPNLPSSGTAILASTITYVSLYPMATIFFPISSRPPRGTTLICLSIITAPYLYIDCFKYVFLFLTCTFILKNTLFSPFVQKRLGGQSPPNLLLAFSRTQCFLCISQRTCRSHQTKTICPETRLLHRTSLVVCKNRKYNGNSLSSVFPEGFFPRICISNCRTLPFHKRQLLTTPSPLLINSRLEDHLVN